MDKILNKTTVAFLSFIFFVIAATILIGDITQNKRYYFANKVVKKFNDAVLVVGDSRIAQGISPECMEYTLGKQVFNFGFDGLGFGDCFYNHLTNVTDEGTVLVFGITPQNFRELSVKNNAFIGAIPGSDAQGALSCLCPDLYCYVEAFQLPENSGDKFHLNGWQEREREIYNMRGPENYKILYAECSANTNRVIDFIDHVRLLVTMGRKVYAFRPPSSNELLEVDMQSSGLSYADLVRDFEAAGGVWIDVPQTRWQTYDGVHLPSSSAIEFSKWLAKSLEALG